MGQMNLKLIFDVCAIAGGALFLIRLALQLIGFSAEGDEIGDASDASDPGDSDASFRALSLLGVTAFLMMFGLGGRAMLASEGTAPAALLVGLAAGGISLWLMGWLFRAMRKMQSSGTTDVSKAIGQEGSVYLTIPANDVGKVQIAYAGRLDVLDARSANGQPIPTGARVKVLRIAAGNVLEVESPTATE
jgi:membrane protein implicated in regulation of membrane protease activity